MANHILHTTGSYGVYNSFGISWDFYGFLVWSNLRKSRNGMTLAHPVSLLLEQFLVTAHLYKRFSKLIPTPLWFQESLECVWYIAYVWWCIYCIPMSGSLNIVKQRNKHILFDSWWSTPVLQCFVCLKHVEPPCLLSLTSHFVYVCMIKATMFVCFTPRIFDAPSRRQT